MIKRNWKKSLKRSFVTALSAAMLMTSFSVTDLRKPLAVEAATTNSNVIVLSNKDRNEIFEGTRTDFRDESIYFTMVTRFYNGDESNDVQCWDGTQYNLNDPAWRGDFKGLIEKLDYIKALGFTAVWITPVVENISGYDYHGYHASNFSKVDERYESEDCTYQDLIDACHDRGMKIIQDVVFNHTGNFGEANLCPMFEKVGDLSSPDCLQILPESGLPEDYNSLLPAMQYQSRLALMKNTDGVNHDVNNLYHHYGNFNWDDYTCQLAQIAGDCVDLNTENPIVYNYLIDAYSKYIDMGVDGFRVDTVRHISRLTFNKALNQAFIDAGKRNGKDFFMFGEVCTRDTSGAWYRNSPSMSTPFYTWKESKDYPWSDTDWEVNYDSAIQCTLDNADNVSEQPTSTNAFLDGNNYHTADYSQFSGLSVIDFPMHWSFKSAQNAYAVALKDDKYYNDATWNVTYVDSHDYAPDGAPEGQRFSLGQDVWAENLSLMFTFRGIPCIYYGSETEFQKGAVIDKGPNIALAESGRAYYGDVIEGDLIATGFASYGNVSGAVKDALEYPLSQHIQRLNRLRQSIPALRKGQYSTKGVTGDMAFKRRYTDSNTDSFVCVSISGNATFTGIPNGKYVDAVTGDVQNVTNGTLSVEVSGKGNLKAYVLDTAKTPAPGRVITNGTYLTDGGAAKLIEQDEVTIVNPTGITVDKTSVSVVEGQKTKVIATVAPANATYKTVTWTSSDKTVATVAGGTITGVAPGTATITAKTTNGFSKTIRVTVTADPNIIRPTSVTITPASLSIEEGETQKLTATIVPENATNKTIKWSSSNKQVATVDGSGNVKGVVAGTATITATTSNGLTKTVTVTVTEKIRDYYENGIYFEAPEGWGDKIYVYMFKDDRDYGTSWPGTLMTEIDTNVYGYKCLVEDDGIEVVFNNGSGSQTSDLAFVQNGYYNTSGYLKTITAESKGKVVVNYKDTQGNTIQTETLLGEVGAEYKTSAKDIKGYTLYKSPDNATGTFIKGTITLDYIYKKDTVDVKIDAPVLSGLTNMKTGVKVSWTKVDNASGYQIYRDGKIVKTSTNGATESITDTSELISGTEYTYTVIAYVKTDDGIVKSTASNAESIVYVGASNITKMENAATGIKVTWSGVAGVDGYKLYVSENGSSYKQIANVASNVKSFLDTSATTNGARYQYKIIAYKKVDGVTYSGAWSAVAKTFYVNRPVLSKVASGSVGKLTAVWGKGVVSGYEVQYSTTSTFKTVVSAQLGADKRTATFSKLKSGTVLYVRVRGYKEVDGVKYYSKWSNTRYAKVQ